MSILNEAFTLVKTIKELIIIPFVVVIFPCVVVGIILVLLHFFKNSSMFIVFHSKSSETLQHEKKIINVSFRVSFIYNFNYFFSFLSHVLTNTLQKIKSDFEKYHYFFFIKNLMLIDILYMKVKETKALCITTHFYSRLINSQSLHCS